MIITENNITDIKLDKIIGKPIKFDINNRQSLGSHSFFLKSFDSHNTDDHKELKIDSKCNFQKYTNGVLMRINYSNKLYAIPIRYNDTDKIELIRGKENISPYFFSPMKLLLKFGVSIRYARYLGLRHYEYRISDTELKVFTKDFKAELITNGFDFENQLPFFESLNLNDKLEIINKPTYNTI